MPLLRPVSNKFPIGLEYGVEYPEQFRHLTVSGRHEGVDYLTIIGEYIRLPETSKFYAKRYDSDRGNHLIFKFWRNEHGKKNTYRMIFMHLSKTLLSGRVVGDTFVLGEIVALTGDSGTWYTGSDGEYRSHPHLHFQVEILKYTPEGKPYWQHINPAFLVGKD